MKVIQAHPQQGLDGLALVDLLDPGDPGPNAIRVRVYATSLNFHDLGVVTGRLPVADGRIPMADGAGVVEAVGSEVSEFRPGDHVVSTFFPTWLDGEATLADFATTPGDGIDGFAREVVVAPATSFTHAPAGWNSSSPWGVVVSICSVRLRKATPRSRRPVTMLSRCGSERPSRSSFHTTRQSLCLAKSSARARPGRSARAPLALSS